MRARLVLFFFFSAIETFGFSVLSKCTLADLFLTCRSLQPIMNGMAVYLGIFPPISFESFTEDSCPGNVTSHTAH